MRIIAGEARGRRIDAPDGMDTRPTLDRVKESVFGTIQFDIYGKTVLDLFAGSGNLGLEALSRGAKQAFFCDMDYRCFDIITNNIKKLGFGEKSTVYSLNYMQMLERLNSQGQKVNLVFLDPPYASGLAQNATEALCRLNLLGDDAIIVAEHSVKQNIVCPNELYVYSQKKYRETMVTIMKKGMCEE